MSSDAMTIRLLGSILFFLMFVDSKRLISFLSLKLSETIICQDADPNSDSLAFLLTTGEVDKLQVYRNCDYELCDDSSPGDFGFCLPLVNETIPGTLYEVSWNSTSITTSLVVLATLQEGLQTECEIDSSLSGDYYLIDSEECYIDPCLSFTGSCECVAKEECGQCLMDSESLHQPYCLSGNSSQPSRRSDCLMWEYSTCIEGIHFLV